PWFGKYYSAGWEDPATLNDVYDKILISDKQLTSFLQNLCSVYDKSPANMRADIAKYYLRLKPEEVHYFSGNCVTNDERSADHMAFPTGYYHTDERGEREEIMLRCAVNTRVPGHKWIARRFYLCSENSFYGRQPQKWLVTWAKFSGTNPNDIDGVVRDLKSMAMPEAWSFSGTDDLSVLRNYFVYTFTRLWREKKVLINVKTNFAAFNTGLVNSTYEYIYAMFRPQNSNDIRHWCFVGFAIEGAAGLGKDLVRSFPKPPHPARYFQKNVPIYYVFNDQEKIQVQIPSYDVEHILLQRTNRLPVSFMQKYLDKVPGLPECYEKARRLQERERVRRQPGQERDPQTQGYDAAAKYAWKELAQLLEGAPDVYLAMKYALGNAVVTAIKRTSWNYRTVIPYYSPKDNKLCLLLPITLGTGDAPDLVMVLEPTEDGAYLGHTVITLAMAYNNSRLVCRPESEWLNMGMIKNAAADEDALDDGDDETDLSAEDDA
ncbi:MAG: DUF3825 domain-containing protein, partial [Pseudoflavonifractor sp.]